MSILNANCVLNLRKALCTRLSGFLDHIPDYYILPCTYQDTYRLPGAVQSTTAGSPYDNNNLIYLSNIVNGHS